MDLKLLEIWAFRRASLRNSWAGLYTILTGSCKDAGRLLQGHSEGIHVFTRIVEVEAGPGRSAHTQVAHEGLAAMVPGANGDPFLIQEGTDIVGMDRSIVKGDDSPPLVRVLGAVN